MTAARREAQRTAKVRQPEPQEAQPPTWRNTRPPGNPETDQAELERNRARMEAVLGH